MSGYTIHNSDDENTRLKGQIEALERRFEEEVVDKTAQVEDLYDKICTLEDRLNNMRTTSNYVLGRELYRRDTNFTSFKQCYRERLEYMEEKIKSLESRERDVHILRTEFDVHKKCFRKWTRHIFPFLDISDEEEGRTT